MSDTEIYELFKEWRACRDAETRASLLNQLLSGLTTKLEKTIRGILARSKKGQRARAAHGTNDTCQEVLMKCLGALETQDDRGQSAFFGWIDRIITNDVIDRLRARDRIKRKGEVRIGSIADVANPLSALGRLAVGTGEPPDVIAHQRAEEAALYLAINRLSDGERQLFVAVKLAGKTCAQAGQELDLKEEAARKRVKKIEREVLPFLIAQIRAGKVPQEPN